MQAASHAEKNKVIVTCCELLDVSNKTTEQCDGWKPKREIELLNSRWSKWTTKEAVACGLEILLERRPTNRQYVAQIACYSSGVGDPLLSFQEDTITMAVPLIPARI